jgi:signal recognition particle subunit SRP54
MLDILTERLASVVKNVRGQARLTEDNMASALRDVRMALLEADVALPVVKQFIAAVREKALGVEVMGSLSPGQALVGVVHRELTVLMGEAAVDINLSTQPPATILLAGLQGAGKTTTAGKLGQHLRLTRKKKVLCASCDIYRPAAIEQLKQVCLAAQLDFLPTDTTQQPVAIAQAALDYARRHHYDVLLMDTAGRLGIDAQMMAEIQAIHAALVPIETLFVVDAMTGQDAVRSAQAFSEALALTGVILTKLDGDARGGAALSVRQMTGAPIKFVGTGEKLGKLEAFHPERMAARILGMGDILGLVEEARHQVDEKKARQIAEKLKKGKGFDFNDFKDQIAQMRKMGGLEGLLDKLPSQLAPAGRGLDSRAEEKRMKQIEGIIDSMTPQERAKPEIIKGGRKRRIAAGSGVQVQDVNRLLSQFEQMQKMMKQLSRTGLGKMMRGMKGMLPSHPGFRP